MGMQKDPKKAKQKNQWHPYFYKPPYETAVPIWEKLTQDISNGQAMRGGASTVVTATTAASLPKTTAGQAYDTYDYNEPLPWATRIDSEPEQAPYPVELEWREPERHGVDPFGSYINPLGNHYDYGNDLAIDPMDPSYSKYAAQMASEYEHRMRSTLASPYIRRDWNGRDFKRDLLDIVEEIASWA